MAHDSVQNVPAFPPPEPAEKPTKQWRPSEDDREPMQQSTISALFSDAAQYGKVIAECCSEYKKRQRRPSCFADLVGHDLNSCEKVEAGRFAQLAVEDSDWTAPDDDSLKPGRFTEEPEAITAESEESSSISGSSESHQTPSTTETPTEATTATAATTVPPGGSTESLALSPEQVVHILEQEFGQLAPEGEEKLLFFKDGAVIQDVVILGVIHVTTHRIAFHASMPTFDPNLSRSNDIIKAGPVLVHRKGLHRKKRVWLELSHDFVSSFPSAREEDHIRPWRSIMLNSILEVMKEDPAHPRLLVSRLDGKTGIKNCHLEFDNIESAREWRRELQAALFFCRRRMRQFLADPDGVTGVRIGIPFDSIISQSTQVHAGTLPMITLTVATGANASDKQSTTSGTNENREGTQSIQLAFHYLDAHWGEMEELLKASKLRRKTNPDSSMPSRVVIDFGLGDVSLQEKEAEEEDGHLGARSREQVVCDWLAIGYTPDVWVTRASLSIGLACTGFLVVSRAWIGFWSKSLTLHDVKYRLRVGTVHRAIPSGTVLRSFPSLRHGLVLELEGQASLRFSFRTEASRNETVDRINTVVNQQRLRPISPVSPKLPRSMTLTPESDSPARSLSPISPKYPRSLSPSPSRSSPERDRQRPRTPISATSSTGPATPVSAALFKPLSRTFSRVRSAIDPRQMLQFPKPVNIPGDCILRIPAKHFVCLTIGSRGDVQPYIALGLGLKKEGHVVTIVTHEEYKGWIEGFGLQHRSAGGDPGALMKLSVENKMFSPQFFKTSLSSYRKWLDQLLIDAWENCKDADILLESPYAMAGVHIAEALNIPYFRVSTMPWTKTVEFPHPFMSAPVDTPTFNSISYVLFDNIFWAATSAQVNRWRRHSLRLGTTLMSHVAQSKIPILYNFSSAVVPKPLDWSDSKIICGYWFLDNPDLDWTPPQSLIQFMEKARLDSKPLVYIGFGSITVPDPRSMTEHIVEAVVKSGVRAIISRGWSSRMSKSSRPDSEVIIPEECYMLDKVPHDWLFPQIDAALHHGGAGTTGASLRAGIPTLIKPWFGDQYFWASRVQKLGAGARVSSLRVSDLTAALTRATTDRIMKERAAAVGQKINAESGVRNALRAILTYFPRASSEGLSPE
ncbi:hypothetical protein NM688_g3691 [Phlebia brevispora]|uniref:Uncharacterized protein n=1 Tax=Phlebia brevispora TaxID=194682 RepID=A0ACC1T4T4_9APHY|nr:hypothetical protein NM688_g3691 [Phlebia brevispora]